MTGQAVDKLADLRKKFEAAAVGKLPKLTCKVCSDRSKTCNDHRKQKCNTCGNYISTAHIDLDYVGHAEVTDRLLNVDPEWNWEPLALADDGGPLIRRQGSEATLWIRLTVCGVTRLGVGSVASNSFDAEKQLIGDALRNAAMRFGVALDLWSKNELESALIEEAAPPAPPPNVDRTTGEVQPEASLPPTNGAAACTACGGPLGTDPVRKGGGGFVHVACPKPPAHPGGPAEEVAATSQAAASRPPSEAQRRALMAASTAAYPDRDARLTWAGGVLGRRVDSFAALPAADAAALLAALDKSPAASPAGGTTAPGAVRPGHGPAPAPTLEEVGR